VTRRPSGLRVEPFAAPAIAGTYREHEQPGAPGVRITYRPPRFEALWVVLSIVLGIALLVGFVAWLGASGGVDLTWHVRAGDPLPYAVMVVGGLLAAVFVGVIVLAAWPRAATTIELDATELRCERGDVVARDAILAFAVDSIEPPPRQELAATNWLVVARTRDAVVTVISGLPTEAHATDVCATLAGALRPPA
jgi:hypothetical protein